MPAADNQHWGTTIDTHGSFDVIQCETCGFIHISPLPDEEDLNRIYTDEYYSLEKPQFIERQLEDIEWWQTVFDDRYAFLEEHLDSRQRTILDIGCGPGFFLQRGSERGWQGCGVEPSRQAAEHAKSIGCEVYNLFLQQAEAEFAGRSFDAVHLSEVLEHIPNPAQICATAHRMLNSGGIVCVVVPNDYNPLQKLLRTRLGYKPYWLAPPHHINYFTFDSMADLLQSAGFSILHTTAMFPMELFLLMGDNYVGNDALGRACHGKRMQFDILMAGQPLKAFREELYKLMAHHGIGREMIIYARK